MADSINSKAKEYYDNDDTGGSLNSNLKDFLVQQGATGKSINTLWRDYAYGEGGTSLNTRLRNLWGTSGSLMKRWKETLGLTWDEVKAFFNFRDIEPDFLLDGSTSFDGSNDYISCSNPSNFNSTTFTLSAWVKPDAVSANQVVFAFGSDTSSSPEGKRVSLFIGSSAKPTLAFWGNDVVSDGTISAGTWTHLAMTFNGGNRTSANSKIYINGVSQTLTGGTASALDLSDMDFANIGADHANAQLFDGSIANVGIWDRALSASEVESIYWRGSHSELQNTELTNLVSWYNLDSTVENDTLIEDEVSSSYTLGSELLTNGDMELDDSSWTNVLSPVTNERSTEQVHSGTYSRKFVGDSNYDGFQQSITTVAGKKYLVSGWIYGDGTNKLYSRFYDSGGGGIENFWIGTSNDGIVVPAEWTYYSRAVVAVGTTMTVQFYQGDQSAGGVTFYADDISVKEITSDGNIGVIYGATTNSDSYSGESPFKPRIQDIATPKMAVQLANGSTDFDGSNDYIDLGDDSSLDITSNISLSFWVKFDNGSATQFLMGRDDDSNRNFELGISSNKLFWSIYSGGSAKGGGGLGSALSDNVWYHITATYDGSNLKTYVNGSLDSTNSGTGAIDNDNVSFTIGAREGGMDRHFNGKMANVAIYSSALTQAQVQELMFTEKYSGLSADLKTNLVSWYDLGSVELGTSLITGDSSDMDTVGSWTAGSWASAVNGSVTSVSGGQTGNAIKVDTDSGRAFARYNSTSGVTVVNGRSYRFSVWGKNGEGEGIVALAYTYGYTHYVNDASATSVEGKVSTYDFQSQDTDLHIALLQASSGNSVLWDDVTVKPINVADSHGSNTGEVYGATTTTGYTHSPHGVVDPLNFGEVYSGRALDFDGSNDYVEVASNGTGTFNNQSYSISAWVNFDEVTSDHAIFSYDNTAHSGTYYASHLRLTGGDKKFFFGWNDGSSYQGLTSASTYLADTWYHVVVTFTSGSQKMYVNGSLDTSSTRSDTITYYAQEVWIGRANYGAYIDGSINSLKYFDSVLTQDQIRQLYTKPETVLPTGVSASNLKLDLPMQEGSGSYVYDGSGNQKHGTISGASWVTGQQYGYQSSLVRSNTPMIFDNVNDGVEIPSSPSLQTWNSKATVQAWVYPNSATDWDGIWGGATASTGTSLSFGSGNTIKLSSDGGSPTVSSTGTVNLKKWNHVVVSYDGSTAYFYINGSSAGSGSYSQDAVASTNIVLGQYYAGSSSTSYKFDGIINEVAYWDTNLDADAVTALYGSGTPLNVLSDSGNYDNSDSLVGYWRNDGITTWTDRANTGVASFDGTNDRINLGSSVDAGTNSTTSIWFKRKTFTSHQALIGEDDNSSDYHMYVYSSNNFFVRNGTKYYVYTDSATTTALNTTDWVHVALVREGISGKLYINGILTETETMESGTSWTANTTFDTIGAKPSGSNGIDGQIAGTHIFNVALTASEVTELYNIDKRSSISGHSQFSNCIGSWLMGAGDGDTASTIQDQTSNNNDGTVNCASIIGYNDGTASGSPVSIVIPEGSTEGRDNQGYYLSNTTSTSNNGLRMYGGGEVIKIDDSELFHLGTKDFTFEFWAKFNETSTTRGFFNYFKDANNRFHLSNYANIDFYANVGGSDQTTQISNTRDLDWHHYVITKESNTMKIYIDSSVVKTNTSWTQDINFTGGTFYIGVRTDDGSDLTSYNVDGSIDEFRIYHKALSSSEVSKNYTNGLGKHS